MRREQATMSEWQPLRWRAGRSAHICVRPFVATPGRNRSPACTTPGRTTACWSATGASTCTPAGTASPRSRRTSSPRRRRRTGAGAGRGLWRGRDSAPCGQALEDTAHVTGSNISPVQLKRAIALSKSSRWAARRSWSATPSTWASRTRASMSSGRSSPRCTCRTRSASSRRWRGFRRLARDAYTILRYHDAFKKGHVPVRDDPSAQA
jgi:hypothetical protein